MASFQVAARALIHLGSELITSDPIAIYELIKNAIDAKSPNVNVLFSIPFPQNDILNISSKWAKLSQYDDTWKKEVGSDLEKLLTVQRNNLDEIITERIKNYFDLIKSSSSPYEASELLLEINYIEVKDTGIGMSEELLNKVFLTVGTNYKLHADNHDRPVLGNKGIGRLSMMRLGKSATVTSWKNINHSNSIRFDWREFESESKLISEINFPISKNDSTPNYSESGTSILITHLTRDWTIENVKFLLIEKFLRRLRNPLEKREFKFPINVYYNKFGRYERLPISPMSKELLNAAQKNVEMSFSPESEQPFRMVITNVDGSQDSVPYQTDLITLSHKLNFPVEELIKVGEIKFNLRWYNRKLFKVQLKKQGLSNRSKELLDELNVWSGGISLYRDGFRIGYSGSFDDTDWFEIDKRALRSKGFTVNRIQMVGSLELTKNGNPFLQDRSNREGLLDNPQWDFVSQLISDVVLQELRENINQGKENEAAEELENVIESGSAQANDKLTSVRERVTELSKYVDKEHQSTLNKINEGLHFVATKINQFEKATSHLKEHREDILELAGTGTMMHVVMHELARTTTQTRSLLQEISKKSDSETSALLNKLEGEIKVLNVRLRQFDPVSTNGRQRKSRFDLVDLIRTILSGYTSKFERHNISVDFTVNEFEDYKPYDVHMVKGFLTIALENLIANSSYWLKQDKVFSHLINSEERTISIDIDTEANAISVSDTGPGIAVGDRERIFTPGFTTKKNEKEGKGFGLFIAREITQYHDGDLYLDSLADEDGRLRRFVIELPKLIKE